MVKMCTVMEGTCRVTNRNTGQLRTVPTNSEVFCAVYDYAGKADLIKGY